MYKVILHPTDLSENHFEICKKAQELAKRFHARLYLLHVIEPPTTLQVAQGLGFAVFDKPDTKDAIEVMSVLGEALSITKDQQLVEVGAIKSHVLAFAKSLACDLIILGSHTPSHLPAFLGSTAHAIMHHAPCDVLTLHVNQDAD